jgi:hypothetical protein
MAEESSWQPNYADLSDDRVVRFGGACLVCGARYATAAEPLAAIPPADREPDPATLQAIEEQKYRLFAEFDAAFRTISIRCYRCGDIACPDCWDVDKQMCGRCVAQRGLTRSPHRGEPVEGPLADGFLRRLEPGRYAEVGRPSWLKDLLRAQSDPEAARAARLSGAPAPAIPTGPAAGVPDFLSAHDALPPSDLTTPRAPILGTSPLNFDPPPTTKMEVGAAAASGPRNRDDGLNGPEGEATSGVIECPRCRTPNYDFVTQCTECGLQLIQVCPTCEKLNPGHATRCQHCGATLERPRGWSGLAQAIVPIAPEEARKRMTGRPMTPRPVSPAAPAPGPRVWGGADEEGAEPAPARPRRPQRPPVAVREREMLPEPSYLPTPATGHHPYESGGPAPQRAAAMSAPSSAPMAARHPYETGGPELQPIMAGQPVSLMPSRASILVGAVGALVERTLMSVLLLGLFAVVAAITAAEASPQANHALMVAFHINIKSQVDHLLLLLHLNGQK